MSQVIYKPYGVAATIDFSLWETDGTDLKVDAAHASGDTKIMKDEGSEANTTNAFADEGQGYSIALTATEMQAARIQVYVVDQGTKAWLDRVIYIETYGHPASAHPSLGIAVPNGLLSGTHTTTTADLGPNAPAELPVNSLVVNLTKSEARLSSAYDDSTGIVTWTDALGTAWEDDDHWYIIYGAPTAGATASAVSSAITKIDAAKIVIDNNFAILDELPDAGALTTIHGNVVAILEDTNTTLDGKINIIDTVVDALTVAVATLQTAVTAVKTVTDQLTIDGDGVVAADTKKIAGAGVTGDGTSENKWRAAE